MRYVLINLLMFQETATYVSDRLYQRLKHTWVSFGKNIRSFLNRHRSSCRNYRKQIHTNRNSAFYPSYAKTFDISCFSSFTQAYKPFDFALKGFKFSNKVGSNICGEGSLSNTAPYKNNGCQAFASHPYVNENYRQRKYTKMYSYFP